MKFETKEDRLNAAIKILNKELDAMIDLVDILAMKYPETAEYIEKYLDLRTEFLQLASSKLAEERYKSKSKHLNSSGGSD